jgi:hypothetical protein
MGSSTLLEGAGGYYIGSVALPLINSGQQMTSRTYPGWSAIGAEANSQGYTMLWTNGSGSFELLQLNGAGQAVSVERNLDAGRISEEEGRFGQDFNGDGVVRVVSRGSSGNNRSIKNSSQSKCG